MADFIKPSHTQSSDEIVSALNSKIAAIATLSLNDGTWTNVPIGTVAFDPDTNQFKRKTAENTWSTVEISLGIGSSLTIGTLNANSVTLLATPTSNNQTLTAASYKLLTDDVAFLKASTIELQTGTSGTDFNITTGAPSGEDLSSSSITKVINLPSASETARGVVTIGSQTFGGLKTFASGRIQLGNDAASTKNWYITTSENADSSLKILNGVYAGSAGTWQVAITSSGNVGIGTNLTPSRKLQVRIDASANTQVARFEDGTRDISILPQLGSGGYNPISSAGDQGIIFSAGAVNTGSLVIAPYSSTASGIRIDASGNVGVGVKSPTEKLDVAGSIQTDDAFTIKGKGCSIEATNLAGDNTNSSDFTITAANSTNSILLRSAQAVKIQTYSGGSYQERITITNAGNVGVGITSPVARIHVAGAGQLEGRLTLKTTQPTIAFADQDTANATNSAFLRTESGVFYLLRGAKGSESWTHNSTNIWPLQIDLNTNEARLGGNLLMANSSSRLGVSTLSPVAALNVVGSNTFSGHTNVSAVFQASKATTSDAGVALGSINGNSPYIAATYLNNGTGAATALRLLTANTERIHITAAGNVGINTGAPTERLHVEGNISATGSLSASSIGTNAISCTSINTNNNIVTCSHIHTGSYDNTLWQGQGAYMSWNNDSESGRTWFTCNRGLGAGGWVFALNNGSSVGGASAIIGPTGSYWASSDYRLKSNVVKLQDCLEKTLCLNPVSYTYNTTQTTEIGFIAHEVQQVVPEVVDGEKDAVYESGESNYQALNYSALIPILTGAIQQLSQKLDKLEAEIIELKTNKA